MHMLEKNYFRVNIRFINANNKPCTNTIVIRDTKSHHASEYLHKLIRDILEEYEIEKDRVVCIVTDSSSNMISTLKKVNIEQEETEESELEIVDIYAGN